MLKVWSRPLTLYQANCYVVACTLTGRAAVIDPGEEHPWIRQVVESGGLTVDLILLTHGHVDHIGGVEWVRSWSGAPVMIHPDDAPMLTDPMQNLSGFFGPALTAPPADRLLAAGDSIAVGDLRLTVLHTPGHSPGSVSFYTEGHLFSGDTLFAGSIGRFDFPGGDRQRLLRSIRERLLVLPPDTAVYPGHGEETTVGDEAAYNPYLA